MAALLRMLICGLSTEGMGNLWTNSYFGQSSSLEGYGLAGYPGLHVTYQSCRTKSQCIFSDCFITLNCWCSSLGVIIYFIYKLLGECPLNNHYWFSSVAQSCPTLCNPMDCSVPGFPVHQQLPGLTQTHVHWVGDAIQPSHPLLSPSLTFSHSQHQGIFKWVNSLHQVAKVLQFQLQHQSFQ